MEIRDIAQRLNEQIDRVVKLLLPGGRNAGREWEAGSTKGEAGRSLKVCLSGAKVGVWADFATGEGGDLLDLWRIAKGLSLSEALKEARAFLGITEPLERIGSKRQYRKPQAPKGARKATENNAVMQYLTETRKLTVEAVAAYRILTESKNGFSAIRQIVLYFFNVSQYVEVLFPEHLCHLQIRGHSADNFKKWLRKAKPMNGR